MRGYGLQLPMHIVMFALVVGSLAACSTGTSNSGTSSVVDLRVSGTAQGWTGGAAVLRAIGTNRDENHLVGYGSIAANGDFILELPEPLNIPDSFGPLTCEVGETGELEGTPSTMRVSLVRSFAVTETRDLDAPEIGEVTYVKGDPAGNDDSTLGMYAYASAPGTVKGTCVFPYDTATLNFDLTLTKGWNYIVYTSTISETDIAGTYRTAALPTDLNWMYYEFPPPPNEGPPPPPATEAPK